MYILLWLMHFPCFDSGEMSAFSTDEYIHDQILEVWFHWYSVSTCFWNSLQPDFDHNVCGMIQQQWKGTIHLNNDPTKTYFDKNVDNKAATDFGWYTG